MNEYKFVVNGKEPTTIFAQNMASAFRRFFANLTEAELRNGDGCKVRCTEKPYDA